MSYRDFVMAAVVVMFVMVLPAVGQTIWHVDDDAPPDGDGLTWDTAFRYLQDALWVTLSGDEIRVAGGTYTADRDEAGYVTPYDRTVAFELIDGAKMYGGYAGLADPASPNGRNFVAYESVLSGDLLGNDGPDFANNWENSWRIVSAKLCGPETVIDGFSIKAAYNHGGMRSDEGSNPIIRRCKFEGNWGGQGGGLYVYYDSAASVVGCVFRGNRSDSDGGAVFVIRDTSVFVVNCVFVANEAGFDWEYASGGALCIDHTGSATVVNSLFLANRVWHTTIGGGAAVYVRQGCLDLVNCTVVGNWAPLAKGGGIHAYSGGPGSPSDVTVTNSIFWWNGDRDGVDESAQIYLYDEYSTLSINHSCVHGWTGLYGGVGNIGDDPLFAQLSPPGSPDDDVRLLPGSPCIDAGDNNAVPIDLANVDDDCDNAEILPVDLAGNPRFTDDPLAPDSGIGTAPIVNMGAYEGADCNGNGVLDDEDLATGYSDDLNENGFPDECEPGLTIAATDPPNGAIDARKPHDENGANPCGWETVDITFDGPMMYLTPLDFTVEEEGADGIPPSVTCTEYVDSQTVRVHLSEMIEVRAWTTVTHVGSGSGVTLGYLPADADGSGTSNANDIVVVVDAVSAGGPLYQYDTDRSGTITGNDIIVLVDLLNGAGAWDAYYGTALP